MLPMPAMSLAPRDAMEEYEQLARQIAMYAEQIVQMQTKLDLLYLTNGLGERIAATESGQLVPGSSYTPEQATAVVEMLTQFKTWFATPLPHSGMPPMAIIFRR